MQTPRAISSTARRYGISRALLLNWRRSFFGAGWRCGAEVCFVPAMMVRIRYINSAAPANGRIVIEIGNDRRIIVDAGVGAAALARVLAILERR